MNSKNNNKIINLFSRISSNVQRREGKELIIFPDIPFWMIVSDGGYKLIKKIVDKPLQAIEDLSDEEQSFIQSLIEQEILILDDAEYSMESEEDDENYSIQSVWLNVESSCNLKCKHCFQGEKVKTDNPLTVEEISILVKDIREVGNEEGVCISVTGGEPLLRKDILEVFKIVNIDGVDMSVITNGLFLNEEIMNYLSQESIPTMISLDGPTKESHEFIRGEGTFEKTVENIRKSISKGIPVTLSMTVHQANKSYIKEMFLFAKKIGAKRMILNFLNDFGNASLYNLEITEECEIIKEVLMWALEDKDIFSLLTDTAIAKLIETVSLPVKTDCCGSGINTCSIGANGDIFPCPSFQCTKYCAGNIRDESFLSIWKDHRAFMDHRALNINNLNDDCKRCDVRLFCGGGCRAQAYFSNKGDLYARSKKCSDYKRTYYELIWILDKYPTLGELYTRQREKIYGV